MSEYSKINRESWVILLREQRLDFHKLEITSLKERGRRRDWGAMPLTCNGEAVTATATLARCRKGVSKVLKRSCPFHTRGDELPRDAAKNSVLRSC